MQKRLPLPASRGIRHEENAWGQGSFAVAANVDGNTGVEKADPA